MDEVVIWHNPRCSKSREAMAWLAGRGIAARVRDYLGEPPSPAEVAGLLARLGGDPRQLVRFKEALAAELGLSPADERPAGEWAALLAANPRLIERPVLVVGGKAAIGRPVEAFEALLPLSG